MVEREELFTLAVQEGGDGKAYWMNMLTLFALVGGMILWVIICTGAWFVSAQGDYASLAIARACYSESSQERSGDPKCAQIKPPDVYMSEVDQKAEISRLASAAGAVVAIGVLLVTRRKKQT